MKPAPFEYVSVDSVEAAVSALARYGGEAKILAGGQSLVPMMNFRLVQPSVLIDINPVAELDYIRVADGWLAIGARTRQRSVEKSAEIKEKCPLLAAAARWIGHPQIRNRGTVGGSLVHGDPTAELCLVATLLDAELVIRAAGKSRAVRAGAFFEGVMATRIGEEELLTEIRFPASPRRSGYGFGELSIRQGDFAVVVAAVHLTVDEKGLCTEARVAVSGAGPKPLRIRGAEKALLGSDGRAAALDEAASRVPAEVDPVSDLRGSAAYRREMARVFVRRALAEAWARVKENNEKT